MINKQRRPKDRPVAHLGRAVYCLALKRLLIR